MYSEVPELNHVTLLALRMGFSLPFFLLIAFFRLKKPNSSESHLDRKDQFTIIGLALFGYYLSSVFDFWGLEYVSASVERLILFIYPTLVVVISLVIYKRRISKIIIIALLFAYTGIALVLGFENEQTHHLKGSILIILAAITYASYLVGSEYMIQKLGNVLYTSIVMSLACIFVLIDYFIRGSISILSLPVTILAQALCMAIFCTVIPSFLISEGIKKIGSANAAVVASIGPISTLFLANYFLGETITNIQLLGTVLVLVGVMLISIFGKKPDPISKK